MAWAEYIQPTGEFTIWSCEDGGVSRVIHSATGYAGRGDGLNNPDAETQVGLGPLPVGVYRVQKARNHVRLGPLCFPLVPRGDTELYGRSGFAIHGDNQRQDRSASRGCIVLDRDTRSKLAECRVCLLIVWRG